MSNFCTQPMLLSTACLYYIFNRVNQCYKTALHITNDMNWTQKTPVTALWMFTWEEITFIKCQDIKWKINAKKIPMKIRGFKEIILHITMNSTKLRSTLLLAQLNLGKRIMAWACRLEKTKCMWNFGGKTNPFRSHQTKM